MVFEIEKKLANYSWYRWLVLASTCLCQLLGIGYMTASINIYPIYYEDTFGDRQLAGQIGSVGISISFLACLPAYYLNQRIGERGLQILGGLLMTTGELTSGVATQGWMAFVGTGILTGAGCAMVTIATFSILPKYFPGEQLVPVAANVLFFNISCIAFPLLIGEGIAQLGYMNCKILCSGLLLVNIVCGFFYIPRSHEDSEEDNTKQPRYSLKIQAGRKGMFEVASTATLSQMEEDAKSHKNSNEQSTPTEADAPSTPKDADDIPVAKSKKMMIKRHSSLSLLLANLHGQDSGTLEKGTAVDVKIKEGHKDCNKPAASLRSYLTSNHGESIADLLNDRHLTANSLLTILRKPKCAAFVASGFSMTFGLVGWVAIIGDFSRYKLEMSDQTINQAMSAHGLAMLVAAVGYLVLAWAFKFSASMLQVVSCVMAVCTWLLLLLPGLDEAGYTALIAAYGLARSLYISNLFPVCIEVASPPHVLTLYMLFNVVCGISGVITPYLILYLQVEVGFAVGLIAISVEHIGSICMYLPFAIKELMEVKRYSSTDTEVYITKLSSQPED